MGGWVEGPAFDEPAGAVILSDVCGGVAQAITIRKSSPHMTPEIVVKPRLFAGRLGMKLVAGTWTILMVVSA